MPSNTMGIRRTVLVEALAMRAEEQGAVLRNRCSVLGFKANPSGAVVYTTDGGNFLMWHPWAFRVLMSGAMRMMVSTA